MIEQTIEHVSTAIERWDEWCDMAGIARDKRKGIVEGYRHE